MIIDRGKPTDRDALPLFTKKRGWIENEQRAEVPHEILSASVMSFERSHPEAVLRSISHTYNCIGLAFASRRTFIDPDQLDKIFQEDRYRILGETERPQTGDMVVYKNNLREALHIGIITCVTTNVDPSKPPYDIMVLSKWGPWGEYLHRIDYVPDALGTPQEYWTERQSV